MSGLQLGFSWQGDQAEIFAQYVLSAIAAVVRVPRQLDFGFDFLCTLIHKRDSTVYTGMSFGVQVKSPSTAITRFGGFDKPPKHPDRKWKIYEINWLYGQRQPLLVCVVDIKELSIKLYSTSRIWWVRCKSSAPTEIVLLPDENPSKTIGEDLCPRTPIKDFDGNSGDGFSYRVPLGDPIVTLRMGGSETEDDSESITKILNEWLEIAYQNILHYSNRVAYIEDIQLGDGPGESRPPVHLYHFFTYPEDEQIRKLLLAMTPAIESLMRNLVVQNKPAHLQDVLPIARLARNYGGFFWSQADALITKFETQKP